MSAIQQDGAIGLQLVEGALYAVFLHSQHVGQLLATGHEEAVGALLLLFLVQQMDDLLA